MMKKLILIPVLFFSIQTLIAQPEDPKQVNETALNFIRSGDYENAILVLNRGLQQDKNNLELQKSLVMAYYYKKDYAKALEGVKVLVDRDDADVMTYQIAGNVYKALEEVKDCDKMYKKALKKFPNSGPLYSEYGELLWAIKDFNAIVYWEKGIQVDPAFSGNYYNAAQHYFYTQDKVWAVIYGEIFVNMESLTERGASMKKFLLDAYKEKLFQESDMLKDVDKNKSEFAKAFLNTMNKQASLANKGISTEVLTMIRTRFILDWYNTYGSKFPHKLFDYQLQLIREGMFEAYNQWLFGTVENLAAYDNWTKTNTEKYSAFTNFQKNRIFRMPATQYYQVQ
jgi:tetratricopeptide (TPR) repeat protein